MGLSAGKREALHVEAVLARFTGGLEKVLQDTNRCGCFIALPWMCTLRPAELQAHRQCHVRVWQNLNSGTSHLCFRFRV